MILFMVVLWFILTFAVLAPLEWWLLRQHLKQLEWWIVMNFIGWILYCVAVYNLDISELLDIELHYTMILQGAILGFLMGFLRGLAFEPQLAQAKLVIASSIISGILSHIFSLYLAFYLVRNEEGLAQAGLLIVWFMFCLTVSYHALNTAALIWLFRDTSSRAQ